MSRMDPFSRSQRNSTAFRILQISVLQRIPFSDPGAFGVIGVYFRFQFLFIFGYCISFEDGLVCKMVVDENLLKRGVLTMN
jgi:hypothetical protein